MQFLKQNASQGAKGAKGALHLPSTGRLGVTKTRSKARWSTCRGCWGCFGGAGEGNEGMGTLMTTLSHAHWTQMWRFVAHHKRSRRRNGSSSKISKTKAEQKKKKKTKRTEMKSKKKRWNYKTYIFWRQFCCQTCQETSSTCVALYPATPLPPSLSTSLSSTTIRFSYVTNVRAFCCCSCFCLEAIGAAVSICSNREKSEFEKWENLNTPQENCFSMSICLLLYCRKQVVKVL